MPNNRGPKQEPTPDIVRGELALIVTSEMHEKIARKRLKRQKARLGHELPTAERAEVDLGDLDT